MKLLFVTIASLAAASLVFAADAHKDPGNSHSGHHKHEVCTKPCFPKKPDCPKGQHGHFDGTCGFCCGNKN
ncbi:hypothetical protein BD779DRAFT_1513232 [Infundibulicybe gibba]|nr:hypothetical protein BD779DRAFT_1513232 [Infundibulicybe gibba]